MGNRLRVVLLVLFLFGLPAVGVLGLWLLPDSLVGLPAAAQPGGPIDGSVTDAAGTALEGVPLELYLVPETGDPSLHATAHTDASGAFHLVAPALQGTYHLKAGGGAWQVVARDLSPARDGPQPVELELPPAAVLAAEIDTGGKPAGGGTWFLNGETGGLMGLAARPVRARGALTGGRFTQGGLPPGTYRLRVELDSGQEVELPVRLAVGENPLRIEVGP